MELVGNHLHRKAILKNIPLPTLEINHTAVKGVDNHLLGGKSLKCINMEITLEISNAEVELVENNYRNVSLEFRLIHTRGEPLISGISRTPNPASQDNKIGFGRMV